MGGNQDADRNAVVGVDLEKDHPHEAYVAEGIPGWEGEMDQTLVHGVGESEEQSYDAEVDRSHCSEAGNDWAETVGLRHESYACARHQ